MQISENAANSTFKLSFDSSLNVVDKSFASRAGEVLANNPVGSASYARLQRHGTNISFVNDPDLAAMGVFDPIRNSITVNMLHHSSADEVASTLLHEATHQSGFLRGYLKTLNILSIRHFEMNPFSKTGKGHHYTNAMIFGVISKSYTHTYRKESIRLEV